MAVRDFTALQEKIEAEKLAAIAAAEAAAATTETQTLSEFDQNNNIDLVQSQQARILSQTEDPWLFADNFINTNTQPITTEPVASAYQLTDQYESPFDAAADVFDSMTDADGNPLEGETYKTIKVATDAAADMVHARPKTEKAIYPAEQVKENVSKAYLKNPDLYRKIHGDADADYQLHLYNQTDAGKQASAFDEMVLAAENNPALIAEKEEMARKAELFKDEPGFNLYLRNRDAFIKQYGQDQADFYDLALGKNKTVFAQMLEEADVEETSGGTVGELGSAMALAKAAEVDSQANSQTILTETDLAASQNDGTETDNSTTVADSIAKELNLDVHDKTRIISDLDEGSKKKNPKEKATWIKSIRSFYKENPELATAIIRAASTYLQTGKWYMAAAAGLEGALEGAGVKIAADQAQLTRQEGLRSKYTPESVNAYNISGNVEDLKWDMTKVDKNHEIYLAELAKRGEAEKAKELRKLLLSLNKDNVTYLEARQDNITASLEAMFGESEKGDGFKRSGFGVEKGDIGSLILLHAKNNNLYDETTGNVFLEQIKPEAMNDIRNIVEEYGRIQYKYYDKNGYVDRNMSLLKFADQQIIRKELEQGPGISGALLEEWTTDPKEGVYAAESTSLVKNTINELIRVNPSFDDDETTVGDFTETKKPTENQIWKQLGSHWTDMGEENQKFWIDAATKQKKPPTSGFLFFANKWVSAGDGHEWFEKRGMQLFQTPKISIPAVK